MTARLGSFAAAWLAGLWVGFVCIPGSAQAVLIYNSEHCPAFNGPWPQVPGPNLVCHTSLVRVNDDGSGGQQLTDHGSEPATALIGPRVVYSAGSGPDACSLWTMTVAGTAPAPLFDDPEPRHGCALDVYPAISTRGQIVFGSGRPTPGPKSWAHLWITNAAGGDPRPLTTGPWYDHLPRFSPDGRRVIFIRYGGRFTTEGSTLESIGVEGQGLAPVTIGSLPIGPFTLSFSPDGQQIAIALNGGDLYTLSTTGSALAKRADGPVSGVTWSPLGPTLFFTRTPPSSTPPCAHSRIYRLDLSQAAAPVPVTDGACDDSFPTWTAVSLAPPPLGNLLPPVITLPKLVNQLLGGVPSLVPQATSPSARSASRRPRLDRLPFLVADPVGIRQLGVAVAQRRSHRRCRFVVGTRFAPDTWCGRARYFDVRSDTDWRRRTQWLPHGRYHVWFRATDTAGRRSKRHLSVSI